MIENINMIKRQLFESIVKCKNCKYSYLDQCPEAENGSYEWTTDSNMFKCSNKKILKGYDYENFKYNYTPDCVLVENDEGWAFLVGPDFGCIHFVEKKS